MLVGVRVGSPLAQRIGAFLVCRLLCYDVVDGVISGFQKRVPL